MRCREEGNFVQCKTAQLRYTHSVADPVHPSPGRQLSSASGSASCLQLFTASGLLQGARGCYLLCRAAPFCPSLLWPMLGYSSVLGAAPFCASLLWPTLGYSTVLGAAPFCASLLWPTPGYSSVLGAAPFCASLLWPMLGCSWGLECDMQRSGQESIS